MMNRISRMLLLAVILLVIFAGYILLTKQLQPDTENTNLDIFVTIDSIDSRLIHTDRVEDLP
jgi:hypothetical protein